MDSAIRYIKKKISSSYITKRIRPSSQPEPNIDEKYFILAENQKWKKKTKSIHICCNKTL